ncbi:hypothetical protein CEXT_200321 [Caerostris extrusa]|uniref:Uncharacterized protein n=1 Tax=Caerostris extrusa TaxID=172846 RepID=A0AAV4SZ34_CAEEX|nr:hypothetical protein CEXT_200321 [Caerostris extrusa]
MLNDLQFNIVSFHTCKSKLYATQQIQSDAPYKGSSHSAETLQLELRENREWGWCISSLILTDIMMAMANGEYQTSNYHFTRAKSKLHATDSFGCTNDRHILQKSYNWNYWKIVSVVYLLLIWPDVLMMANDDLQSSPCCK